MKPPYPISPFPNFREENSFLLSPLPLFLNNRRMVDLIINYDCNTSRGLIPYGFFTSWKFKFAFDLRLRDLQLHMLQFFYFGFGLYSEYRIDSRTTIFA